jgi:hypothetical protein
VPPWTNRSLGQRLRVGRTWDQLRELFEVDSTYDSGLLIARHSAREHAERRGRSDCAAVPSSFSFRHVAKDNTAGRPSYSIVMALTSTSAPAVALPHAIPCGTCSRCTAWLQTTVDRRDILGVRKGARVGAEHPSVVRNRTSNRSRLAASSPVASRIRRPRADSISLETAPRSAPCRLRPCVRCRPEKKR